MQWIERNLYRLSKVQYNSVIHRHVKLMLRRNTTVKIKYCLCQGENINDRLQRWKDIAKFIYKVKNIFYNIRIKQKSFLLIWKFNKLIRFRKALK